MKAIRLRSLTLADLEKTLKWHNMEDISEMYLGHPFPINLEMEHKWYEKILTSNIPVTVFGIELIQNKCLIGLSILKDISLINRSAEFAIYIGDKDSRGKGLSKEATVKTLNFAFNDLGLNRVGLKVLEENQIAIKLYKSIGFTSEGVLRHSIFKKGHFKSEIIMSILRDEFKG